METGVLKKIWANRWMLRSIHKTIFFNFYYLPFKQAIKMPIVLYKPKFQKLGGRIILDVEKVRPMMVRWGNNRVSIYPNTGINISIEGDVVIKGDNIIGNNSSLSVGAQGKLLFNGRFSATTTLRVVCYNSITFGSYVTIGWDTLFMDNDFHCLTKFDGTKTKCIDEISIGSYNWFGNGCRVMKRTKTPNYTTIQAGTWLNTELKVSEYSVIGNRRETVVLATGMYFDVDSKKDDKMN